MKNNDNCLDDNQSLKKLCNYFSEFIDSSMLEKTIKIIRQDTRFDDAFQNKYYLREKYLFGDLSSLVIDFDFANVFTMNYWYHYNLPLSKNEMESDIECKLIGSATTEYFQQTQVKGLLSDAEKSLPYNRISILFYMRCLINIMNNYLKRWFSLNGEGIENNKSMLFHYNSYHKIVKTIQSVLNLISSGDMENALPLLRLAIEDYFTYIAINDNNVGLNEYFAIMDAKADYRNKKSITDSTKSKAKNLGLSLVEYSDWGWLKAMADELGISVKLTFQGLLDFSNKKYSSNQNKNPIAISYWLNVYNNCSEFAHSNQLFYSDTVSAINVIAAPLSLLTLNLAEQLKIFFEDIDFKFNGVDIESRLKSEYDLVFDAKKEKK